MGKLLEIFRAGRHTAMSGATLDFSEAAIAAAATAYDPAIHEAPLVVGHPVHNAPAYGWVASLESENGSLKAEPTQVDATFQEWIDQGRYKKISASFYSPNSAQNPVPGIYYLRHVGFLGAMPPAIKGMAAVEFAEEEDGVVTLMFSEKQPRVPKGSPHGGEFAPMGGSAELAAAAQKLMASIGRTNAAAKNMKPEAIHAAIAKDAKDTAKTKKTPELNEVDDVQIESIGKFEKTSDELKAAGGMVFDGSVEVNAFTKHTDPENRAEDMSDQTFWNMSVATHKAIQKDPDLLKTAIAIHAAHTAKSTKDDFLDIPGTNYKIWSNPAAKEIPSLMTHQEYENFAEFGDCSITDDEKQLMNIKEQELNQRETAVALRERAATLKEQELQFSEALDGVIKEGRILAAEKAAHLKRLKMLAAIPADSIADFSEGKADYSPTAEYLMDLKKRPVVVNFGEVSGGEIPTPTDDPNAIARGIKAEIKAAKEAGEEISFAEAELRFRHNGGLK